MITNFAFGSQGSGPISTRNHRILHCPALPSQELTMNLVILLIKMMSAFPDTKKVSSHLLPGSSLSLRTCLKGKPILLKTINILFGRIRKLSILTPRRSTLKKPSSIVLVPLTTLQATTQPPHQKNKLKKSPWTLEKDQLLSNFTLSEFSNVKFQLNKTYFHLPLPPKL